jgi:hypothetical protein
VSATATAPVAQTGRASLSLRLAALLAEELGQLPGAEPWRGEVLRRAAAFQDALRTNDVDSYLAAATALVGLGEGSTPAGDDYLIGVLHALTGCGPALAGSHPLSRALGSIGERRTSAVSAAWLAAAARGDASPVWRALLDALVADDEVAVRHTARAVCRTGHTSGAFSLRGFLDTLS